MASRSRELIGHCRYPRSAKSITSAGKRKPRNARAVVMDGILGRVVAGVPLLPGHAAPLNATEPNCQTPMLVLPDDTPAHPYQTSVDIASLAPNAEVTVYPWK